MDNHKKLTATNNVIQLIMLLDGIVFIKIEKRGTTIAPSRTGFTVSPKVVELAQLLHQMRKDMNLKSITYERDKDVFVEAKKAKKKKADTPPVSTPEQSDPVDRDDGPTAA